MNHYETVTKISNVLTLDEQNAVKKHFTDRNPRWKGAGVADILDALFNRDANLDVTEPLYEEIMEHHKDLRFDAGAIGYATLALYYSYGIAPLRHTVVQLCQKAGCVQPT